MILDNILFLFASFLAAFAATLAGFGSSTLLIPVAIFFMDIKTAVFIVACFHLFNNLFKVHLFWGKIDFKTAVLFGVPSILFAYLGARFITEVPIDALKRFLAGFLVVFSVYSFWKPDFKIHKSKLSAIIGGGLSGFLAGLIGLGGAIRAMFLVSFQLPKEVYVATAAIIAMVVDLTRIPTYIFGDVVQDASYYKLLPFMVVTAYAGVRLGKAYLYKISQNTFKKIVLAALLLVGVKLFFS